MSSNISLSPKFSKKEPERKRKTEEEPLPELESQTGVVYTCGSARDGGQLVVEEGILGKKIFNVSSTMSHVYVLCDEPTEAVHDVTFAADESTFVDKIPYQFMSISGGKSTAIGLTCPDVQAGGKQELYSWGRDASYGELGLGALTNCDGPLMIPTNYELTTDISLIVILLNDVSSTDLDVMECLKKS